jgi:spore germination cell wall hydrolase CwlJ-like protein
MMDWAEFDKFSAALCAWREARGNGREGMRAVLHTIANRAAMRHQSWAEVVYAHLQFSSMTYSGDPQLSTIPVAPDPTFVECYDLATLVYSGTDPDLTGGAWIYFASTMPRPRWAVGIIQTLAVGDQLFFKSAPTEAT